VERWKGTPGSRNGLRRSTQAGQSVRKGIAGGSLCWEQSVLGQGKIQKNLDYCAEGFWPFPTKRKNEKRNASQGPWVLSVSVRM
jgi:hypothetical protein